VETSGRFGCLEDDGEDNRQIWKDCGLLAQAFSLSSTNRSTLKDITSLIPDLSVLYILKQLVYVETSGRFGCLEDGRGQIRVRFGQ